MFGRKDIMDTQQLNGFKYKKTMKPKNISDVIENLEEHLKKSAPSMDRFERAALFNNVRSQVQQLLESIDTERKANLITEKRRLTYSDIDESYNKKCSEIANQIKEMKL